MIAQVPADSLQGVLDTVFAAPKYAWVPRVNPGRWLFARFLKLVEWFEALRSTAPLAYWAVVVLAVVVLVAILVHAGWLMVRTIRTSSAPDAAEVGARPERRDAAWHRRRAARLAAEGRYAEAMRAGFEATALDLAAAGLVQWHPSKTPREYVREARIDGPARLRLAALVDGVYAASFAGQAFGAPDYEAWQRNAGGRHGA